MMITIFDLDGTVVDSSHRILTLPDGSIDISHWRANSTYQKVMRDRELPLANHWRNLTKSGKPVLVCTARVMRAADYAWLREHGLFADLILSRKTENDTRSGVEQKTEQLARFSSLGSRVTFWEDCPAIRNAVRAAHGFNVKDPAIDSIWGLKKPL